MNMFWAVYKNLEAELISISNNIYFCDSQNEVYSIHISDLLIRTAVEIEALSKQLYKDNGGDMNPLDEDGNPRDLMFDTDCIQYLDMNWGITKRIVNVVCPSFHFTKHENLVLRPLKDCNKRGQGRWKKAYQAVKHNRVEALDSGNVANLIRALAALYILNIYYRNEVYNTGTLINTEPIDARMGSRVFSISISHAEKYNFNQCNGDESIDEKEKSELSGAVMIQKITKESFKLLKESLKKYNEECKNRLLKNPKVFEFYLNNPDYKIKSYMSFAQDVGGDDMVKELLKGQEIINTVINKSQTEVVLNKQQQIYPQISNDDVAVGKEKEE